MLGWEYCRVCGAKLDNAAGGSEGPCEEYASVFDDGVDEWQEEDEVVDEKGLGI